MAIILDWETLESALVNMSLARCLVMGMIPHHMRQGDPTQEIAHSSIFGRLEHEVPMIRHQLRRKNAAWIADKPFGKNILKRFVVAFLVENDRSSIATVQGMVDRILLVGAFGAGHPQSLATPNLAVKSPDPFSSLTEFSHPQPRRKES